jgi:hypothetical protein
LEADPVPGVEEDLLTVKKSEQEPQRLAHRSPRRHSGVAKGHPRVTEALVGAVETHPRVIDNRYKVIEAHFGAKEAHPGIAKAHSADANLDQWMLSLVP